MGPSPIPSGNFKPTSKNCQPNWEENLGCKEGTKKLVYGQIVKSLVIKRPINNAGIKGRRRSYPKGLKCEE